jgi:oligopeptide transport system substrate-binding protein
MPDKRRKLLLLLISFLLPLLLLSGCGTAPSPAAKPAEGELAATQEFRANIQGEPPTLDPNLTAWESSVAVISLVFDGLLRFKEDLGLAPAVAREVPTLANGGISEDGKTYTLKLRDDVKWSDGKAVTAKDFEYSVKRMLNPKLAAEYASFYYAIQGAKEYNTALGTKKQPKNPDPATLARLREGVGVRALDSHTLQFTLKEPRASFVNLLALWPVYPLRQDIIEAKGERWYEDPASYIGNGPFKVTEWVRKDHITLEPNPYYYDTKPKLDKVTLVMVADAAADYAAYQAGEREIVRVPSANIASVQADPTLKGEVLRWPRLATMLLLFNNKKPPFDNLKVRQALSMAFDRETFVQKIRGGSGKPAYSWIPPGMPGYQPELGKEYAFNPAKARETLAAAGFPGGQGLPPIALHYAAVGPNQQIAEFTQAQFKDNLGIEIKLEPLEPRQFASFLGQKKYQMAFVGWSADYPDPENWLPEFFGSQGGNNLAQYSNPRFDELAQKALVELDGKKRLELWAQAQKIVVDDAASLFIFHDERIMQVKPYVKGLKVTALDKSFPGNWFLKEVSILKH